MPVQLCGLANHGQLEHQERDLDTVHLQWANHRYIGAVMSAWLQKTQEKLLLPSYAEVLEYEPVNL